MKLHLGNALTTFFSTTRKPEKTINKNQMSIFDEQDSNEHQTIWSEDISEFIDFLDSSIYDGNIYLFGGIIRDLAMFGREGFKSDVDIVVDGDWELVKSSLIEKGQY